VATEAFFELPEDLRELHPALYEELRDYYRQDPAAAQEFTEE
jgi:Mlc titration factor MtfA (ptsG expression regulator)